MDSLGADIGGVVLDSGDGPGATPAGGTGAAVVTNIVTVGGQPCTIATRTASEITCRVPPAVASTAVGTAPSMKATPCSCMYVLQSPAICWSKPRSGIERIITVVSKPTPWMKPAHSSAT